jgi:bacterial/archaeal transporter family protein
LATAIRTIVILIIAWSIVWAGGQWQGLFSLSQKTLLFLVLSGIATGLSWLCYFKALQMAPASWVAPVDKLGLALVLILSFLFLGEAMTLKTILGTVLMLSGTLVLIYQSSSGAVAEAVNVNPLAEAPTLQQVESIQTDDLVAPTGVSEVVSESAEP